MKKVNSILGVFLLWILVGIGVTSASAFVFNGDFETGDLTGYRSFEGLVEVPSSNFVQNVDDGTGNRVGELSSGRHIALFNNYNLGKNLGALPDDVQDLFFDVKFFDLGLLSGENTIGRSPFNEDFLSVYFYRENLTGRETHNLFFLRADLLDEFDSEYEILSNGFYRIKADLRPYAGVESTGLRFELWDSPSPFLSKAQIDNIEITTLDGSQTNNTVAPEPSTMFLLGGGLAGMFWRSRNRKLS